MMRSDKASDFGIHSEIRGLLFSSRPSERPALFPHNYFTAPDNYQLSVSARPCAGWTAPQVLPPIQKVRYNPQATGPQATGPQAAGGQAKFRLAPVYALLFLAIVCGSAGAGPLQLSLEGNSRDLGFDGVSAAPGRASLTNEPALQVDAPSLLPGARDVLELRAGHELTYRRKKGDSFTRIESGTASFSLLKSFPKTSGRSYGLGLRFEPNTQDITIRSTSDSGRLHGDFRRFSLSAGMRAGANTSFGLNVGRDTLNSPFDIPTLSFGGIFNNLSQLRTDYTLDRARLEVNRRWGQNTLRAFAGRLSGDAGVRTTGFPDSLRLPVSLSGRELFFDAQHRLSGPRSLSLSYFDSSADGANRALLNGNNDLGPTAGSLSQKRIGLFWRRETPKRALAIGFEKSRSDSAISSTVALGPLDPGNVAAATGSALLEANLHLSSALFKVGYTHQKSESFSYSAGLQAGRARIHGLAAEETRLLFGGVVDRNEKVLKDRTRNVLVPTLGFSWKPGRARLAFQIGQVIPLPEHKSGGGSSGGGGGSSTPSPKSRTFGGTTASVSLQIAL